MDEIRIEIDCLKSKKADIQIAISTPFAYGRSPADKEYIELIPLLTRLSQVHAKIDVLEELLCAIKSNIEVASNKQNKVDATPQCTFYHNTKENN